MENLYLKFQEAQKNYESKEEKKRQIIKSIRLTDEIEFRKYPLESKNKTLLYFQKKVDFSKIEEEYYILHEENNPDFFNIEENYVETMYILIPKNIKEKTLSLVITRIKPSLVELEIRDENYDKSLYYCTNLYCEKSIHAQIMEYCFFSKMQCIWQSEWSNKSFELKVEKYNYKEVIKEYIRNNYLNNMLTIKISASDDYNKYINYTEYNTKCTAIEELIAKALKNRYKELVNLEIGSKKSSKIKGYNIKYEIYKKSEIIKAEIIGDNDICTGFVNANVLVLIVNIKIIYKGSIVDERNLKFIEEQTFQDKLSNYIGKDFILNV